jgi:curli production assembly/transport component CsgG
MLAKQSKFKATIGYTTAVHEDLRSLPPPKGPVVVAVYNFRDQTGQYKTGAYGQTWSMAVTQGATSMLIKALEDSKWFISVEREGLSDLMNERKIIAASREIQAKRNGEQPLQLPPLLYAGIILEGGIISYETNLISTGLGIRYFGLGGDTRLQQDRVTVYLRAVSSQTGEVIKTVHASKNILSEQLEGGVYRFVRFKKLLEVEAGISTNEPVQMCVLEAIEKAVLSLIVEGLIDSTWSLRNKEDINSPVIREYIKEKENGNTFESASIALWNDKKLSCQFASGTQLTGAEGHRNAQLMIKNQLQYDFNPFFSGIIGVSVGKISGNSARAEYGLIIDFKTLLDFLPQYRVSPCLTGGAGIIKSWVKNPNSSGEPKYPLGFVPALVWGCELRYSVTKKNTIFFAMENHITTDDIDGLGSKTDSDKIISFSLGTSIALTGRSKMK